MYFIYQSEQTACPLEQQRICLGVAISSKHIGQHISWCTSCCFVSWIKTRLSVADKSFCKPTRQTLNSYMKSITASLLLVWSVLHNIFHLNFAFKKELSIELRVALDFFHSLIQWGPTFCITRYSPLDGFYFIQVFFPQVSLYCSQYSKLFYKRKERLQKEEKIAETYQLMNWIVHFLQILSHHFQHLRLRGYFFWLEVAVELFVSEYGDGFLQFVLVKMKRLGSTFRLDYQHSNFRRKNSNWHPC